MEHPSQQPITLRSLSHSSNDPSPSRFESIQRIPSPPTSASLHHIPDLQADIKSVLEHIVTSHDEQKKMSKKLAELTTTVKTLERVLCRDVGRTRKRKKNTNSETINKGGIVNRLVDMEASIDKLLSLVTGLKAAPCTLVHHDESTSTCTPSQRGHVSTSDTTNEYYVPANAPSSLPDPNTLYTKVPTNEPGRFLSSSLATPFPDSPRSNSSSGANNKFKSRSLGSLDQNLSTTSPNRTPEPFFHSTAPLSAEVTHTPTRACIPPKFNARNIASHPASPHFTPTSSSTASSGDFPASNTTPVSSTPPLHIPAFNTSAARPPFQSSPSSSTSSTQTVIMHSPNPTRSPNSALTQARALSLSCILSHAQPNGEEHVDCEGLCAHSRERQENPDQLMDSPERQCQSMDPESQDQNQRIDSEEQRIDEETGNPGQDTDLDMSAGEFNSLPAETNANADVTVNTRGSAPVLETALEVGSMPVDPPPTLGTPFPPRTSSNVLDDIAPRELEDVETYVPGPVRTREVSDTNEDERGVDPDENMHVDHASNSPVREPESEREDVRERIMEEELRIESEGGHLPVDGSRGDFVKPAEERFAPAFAPSMGNPSQQTVGNESGSQGHSSECPQELYTDPGDNTQPENILPDSRPAPSNLPDPGNNVHSENILSEPRQSTPLDLPRSDADHVEQYKSECGDLDGSLEESVKPAEEYPALAFEQNTALQSQQTFENQYQGRSSEYPGDSVQPENVFSEKLHQPTPSDLPRSDADRLEQHQFEGSDLGRSLKESVQLAKERSAPAFAPDTGVPNQQTFESQSQGRPSQHQNVLSKSCHPTPSDLPRSDADYLGEHEPLHVEDPREPTPADSLLQDEEDVAAVLTAVPLSPEGQCTPSPFSPKPAFLPPQSEPETQNGHGCSGMRDLGDGIASRDLKEEFSRDDDDFDASSLIFSDTDGATSDHREHVESDIRASEISAQPEEVNLGRTISVTTPPPLLPSFQLSSLSPLSSLAGSPPRLEDENDERRNETKIELRRTGSLDSDMEFGAYRIRSGSSVSALQKKKKAVDPRKSSASLVPRGGHSASMEELSLLARKNPSKPTINLSGLKRKLGSTSQSTIQQPEKKIRFNKDGDGDRAMIATSLSMDDADSSFAGSIRGPDMSDPMHQSSRPPTTMQDVTAFEVGRVSALMKVDSASVIASGTTAEMKRTGTPSNELLVGSTQLPKKRFRQISQKARESTGSTQKVRQPRKDASGMPNKRAPQKRKSKSTSVQDEALVCQWPERSDLDGSVARQFVQCDNCDLWYHFGCVGIVEEDPRLEPDASFICPPCSVSAAKRQTLRNRDEKCARPDCLHSYLDAQEYIIERLVGRKPVGEAGYLFLVKWEGYPIGQATWTPEGNMGGIVQTIARFVADAKAEGIDLRTKDSILLEEARVGGWEV